MPTIKVGSKDAYGFHPNGDIVDPDAIDQFIGTKYAQKPIAPSDLPSYLGQTALNATYGFSNPTLTVTYNTDGTVASTVENGITTTFTYNTDGTVNTQTRAGITKTFTYDANGNVTGAS